MKLSQWESAVNQYTFFEYRSDDNPLAADKYISYAFRFSSAQVVPAYPSLIVLKGSASQSLAFWNVRGVFVVHSGKDYDLIKCVCLSPHDGKKRIKSLFFRAFKI